MPCRKVAENAVVFLSGTERSVCSANTPHPNCAICRGGSTFRSDVTSEVVQGGITNILILVNVASESFLVRFFGPDTCDLIDRQKEQVVTEFLQMRGLGKRIYLRIHVSNGGTTHAVPRF